MLDASRPGTWVPQPNTLHKVAGGKIQCMDLGPPTQNENNLAGATRKPEPCFVLTEWPWRVAASCSAPPSPSCDVVWLACSRYGCTDADIRDTDRPASDGVLQLERVLDIQEPHATPKGTRGAIAIPCVTHKNTQESQTHNKRIGALRSKRICDTYPNFPLSQCPRWTCTNGSKQYVPMCTNGSKQYVQNECCTCVNVEVLVCAAR